MDALEANQGRDLKGPMVLDVLLHQGWLDEGYIIFSQYFDSIWWWRTSFPRKCPRKHWVCTLEGGAPA